MAKTAPHFARRSSFNRQVSLAITVFSIFLVVMGALGLVFLQPQLQKPQELRQQAATSRGQITLAANYQPPSGSQTVAQINLSTNTQGLQVDVIQLVFNVVTNVISDPPLIQVAPDSGLEALLQEVEATSDGFLVSVILAPIDQSAYFSSSANRDILHISFTPQQSGSLQLAFDNDNSVAHVNGTAPTVDNLSRTTTQNFTVALLTTSPSPTPSPSAAASVEPSPSPTDDGGGVHGEPDPTPTPSPSAVASASPSPTPSPAVGGTIAQCNQSCASNAECATNYRCYESRCRLVTNVSSTSCSAPPDLGLQRQCNEYCADTRECASGYSCFNNRCRRPDNPDNTSCAASTAGTQQAIAQGCNATCSHNGQCAVNLRCYNGSCRLATNPSSLSCAAASRNTVTQRYYQTNQPAPLPTTTKGGVAASPTNQNPYLTVSPSPVSSPSLRPSTSPSLLPTPKASPVLAVEPPTTDDSWLSSLLTDRTRLLSMVALGGGALLLLIMIVITVLGIAKKRPSGFKPTTSAKAPTSGTGTGSGYEQYLQQRINQMQGQASAAPAGGGVTPATSPMASAPVNPTGPAITPTVTATPKVITAPPTVNPAVIEKPPGMGEPTTSAVLTSGTYTPQTSMLEKVHQRGINTPGQGQPPTSAPSTPPAV